MPVGQNQTQDLRVASWTRRLFGRKARAADGPAEALAAQTLAALSWVDLYFQTVKPFVFVRCEDNLLIKRPNRAHKLNQSGAILLDAILGGTPLRELVVRAGSMPERHRDLRLFFGEVRRFIEGGLDESFLSSAVSVEPLSLEFSKLPVLSEIAITYRCNLRCVFCYAGCSSGAGQAMAQEMTTEQVFGVLERLFCEGRVPSVSFTGGEPTIREDLPRLVVHAKQIGMWVNLITNGTLLRDRLVGQLIDAGLDSAQVSLEGTTPEIHDRATGVFGSHARSVEAVLRLKEAGLRVHTHTTIQAGNLRDVLGMPDFVARTFGLARLSMNLVIPTGTAATNHAHLVRYAEIGPVLEQLKEASEATGVELMWYSPTPVCLFNPIQHGLGNHGCAACDGLISIAPNGDVLPCSSYAQPVGNLLEQSIADVWDSVSARRLRDKAMAPKGCRDCAEFAVCHGACPLYWEHFGCGELAVAGQKDRLCFEGKEEER